MNRLPLAVLLVLAPAAAHAFDCKKAQSPREKLVCATPELRALDSQLNALYAKARKSRGAPEDLGERQKRWLAETLEPAAPDVKKVADAYRLRIDQLQAIAGKLAPQEQAGKTEAGDGSVPVTWITAALKDTPVLRYPKVDLPKAAQLNAQVAAQAHQAVEESIGCATSGRFDNFTFKVDVARAGLYGVTLDDASGGCLCGCAHPDTTTRFQRFWDARSGEAIDPPLQNLFTVRQGQEEALRKILQASTAQNAQFQQLEAPCKAIYAEASTFDDLRLSFNPKAGTVTATPVLPHVVQACAVTLEVPASAVAGVMELNRRALGLLPRFEEAGLLSADDAAAIHKVLATAR